MKIKEKVFLFCVTTAVVGFVTFVGYSIFLKAPIQLIHFEEQLAIAKEKTWWHPGGHVRMQTSKNGAEIIAAIQERQDIFSKFIKKRLYVDDHDKYSERNANTDRIYRIFEKLDMGIKVKAGHYYKHRYDDPKAKILLAVRGKGGYMRMIFLDDLGSANDDSYSTQVQSNGKIYDHDEIYLIDEFIKK